VTPAAVAELLDTLSRIGVLGVAALVIFGFLTERIIPKGRLEEMRKEMEEFKTQERAAHAEALKEIRDEVRRLGDEVRSLKEDRHLQ
jgi:uncharacterized membrane protein (DUF106 family)